MIKSPLKKPLLPLYRTSSGFSRGATYFTDKIGLFLLLSKHGVLTLSVRRTYLLPFRLRLAGVLRPTPCCAHLTAAHSLYAGFWGYFSRSLPFI